MSRVKGSSLNRPDKFLSPFHAIYYARGRPVSSQGERPAGGAYFHEIAPKDNPGVKGAKILAKGDSQGQSTPDLANPGGHSVIISTSDPLDIGGPRTFAVG